MRFSPIAGVALLGIGLAAGRVESAGVPKWTADPALVKQLAGPVAIGPYRVRPPKGYVRQTVPVRPGAQVFAWQGPLRLDGTRPTFMVMILTPPNGEKPSLDIASRKLLGGIERRRTGWSASNPEKGSVGGILFLRARWSGADSETGIRMIGLSYAGVDRGSVVHITSQDIEAHPDAVRLAEAAARTLARK